MRFHLINNGICTRLKLVGEELSELLIKNDWQKTDLLSSKIIFINSCSFLKKKEDEFLLLIKKILSEKNQSQKIAIFGCLPSTSADKIKVISSEIKQFSRDLSEIAKYFNLNSSDVKVNFTNNDKLTFREKIILTLNTLFLKDESIKYRLKKDEIFHLKISDGCKGNCSYCSEKFTTKHRSRKTAEIIIDFEKGLKSGYKLFALNSDDTSAFGVDNGESIYDLLSKMTRYGGDYKIAVPEFNPRGLFENRVIELLSLEKIIYITIPIQSGSNRILKLMQRPYEINSIIRKIRELKNLNPKLKINTHIIVGFPGETDADFNQTLKIISTGLFDRVKIFAYSDRPRTEASKMKYKISSNVINKREKILKRRILLANLCSKSLANFLLNTKTMN